MPLTLTMQGPPFPPHASVAAAAAREIGELRARVEELEETERELSKARFLAKGDADARVDAERRADAAEARALAAENAALAADANALANEVKELRAKAADNDKKVRQAEVNKRSADDATKRLHRLSAEHTKAVSELTSLRLMCSKPHCCK